MRATARKAREALAAACPDFARLVSEHADALPIPDGSLVGAYIAMAGEADPQLLLRKFSARHCTIAFPRVVAKGQPLQFHRHRPGATMEKSAFGVLEPLADWPIVTPSILLIPMLAFDAQGYRLGYGGGFYDRTLATLRTGSAVTAIGVSFAGQEVAQVPRDANDQKLDMVVTERGLRRFR